MAGHKYWNKDACVVLQFPDGTRHAIVGNHRVLSKAGMTGFVSGIVVEVLRVLHPTELNLLAENCDGHEY